MTSHECTHVCGDHTAACQSLEETLFTSRQSIHRAVIDDDVRHATALLDADVTRVSELDTAGYLPLLYARSEAMVKLLVSRGANVRAYTREGQRTLLHRAAARGDLKLVNVLLVSGARDVQDREGKSARDLALQAGHNDVAKVIASHSPA